MLRALYISDFVIVDRVDLEFAGGFTVLTGETGAGKSILIDALALALGGRGDASVVRQGAEKAEISADFDVRGLGEFARWLDERELAGTEQSCLMRRVIDRSGRSRAFINGRAVTVGELRDAGAYLVEIHGQHEHQSLVQAPAQRSLLDAYAGLEAQSAALAGVWREWQALRKQVAELATSAAALAAEREQLEWQVRELDALKFDADEFRELLAEHARLAHAQSLIEGSQYAMDTLSEDEQSSVAQLAAVASRLDHLLEYDARLKEITDVIASAQAQVQEVVYMLRDYQRRLDLDPQRYRQVEQRLDAVHATARKFRVTVEALPKALTQARERLDALRAGADVEALREREAAACASYKAAARKLSAARGRAAAKLSAEVTAVMQKLALAGGSLQVELRARTEGAAHGLEDIEFLVSAHKSVAPQPLAKVASGGELSRLSLAVQTVTSKIAGVPTLVFDEVDAGIGGRVAEIVGQLLKALGAKYQIMCITHLPQVAAQADSQWQVAKAMSGGNVLSRVTVLQPAERIDEIARMLGGVKITETTRKHAAEMLASKG